MDLIVRFILVIFFILLNAYFVAAEFSLITVRKTRINELVRKGSNRAKLIQDAQRDFYTVISATQLGVTIASLAIGWFGESTVAEILQNVFHFLPSTILLISSQVISLIVAFIVITFLQIVIGEFVPKSIALQRTERTALLIILPLLIFSRIFAPFIWLLNHTGDLITHLLGFTPVEQKENYHSEDEIKMLLRQSGKHGVIPNREIEIVQNVFQLNDTSVKSVLIPRIDILAFDLSTTIENVISKIINNKHSRFPVYEQTLDSIVGFIHIKDIYKAYIEHKGGNTIAETKIIRPVIIIPEIKKIDSVLQEMKTKRVHMAVVTDEYGGTEGIVTLEDVFESLVGEIDDEFDIPSTKIKKNADGTYTLDGTTLIEDVEQAFSLTLHRHGYTTIGGLVFGLLGHKPRNNDTVTINTILFTIEQVEGNRIKSLQAKHVPEK